MSAPVPLPPADFPRILIPRWGWQRSSEGTAGTVYTSHFAEFRITVNEGRGGKLLASIHDGRRLWLMNEQSARLAWLAARQCISARA